MSTILQDDKGNTSSTRVAYFIKLAVGVGALAYCIYQKWLPMEMTILLGTLFGINALEKTIAKKLEK